MVTRAGLYPLGDYHYASHRDIRAQWTGEKRPPRKGEWYLSGAIVCAYQAQADLDTPYLIASIVKTRTITITERI